MKAWQKNILINGLSIAAKCGQNGQEILDARTALEKQSPVAAKRAARALSNALARGGRETLTEDEERYAMTAMTAADDLAHGREPEGLGAALRSVALTRGRPTDGDVAASSNIHLRVTPERKTAYVNAAQRQGKNLTDWMTDRCDAAAGIETLSSESKADQPVTSPTAGGRGPAG